MSYIWTWQGWLFLAAIVDVFSRRVVGWAMATCTCSFLSKHSGWHSASERGLVHHSDRGCQ